ncbi:MAG: TetM/TetW/TetO/TetS family tetracycline resistance ribosomal protection protein [Chloroflexi bacterium]|nr:TetM/TetW/TetO/TetS family tetracycline resistance ribosomal protection protein [Chloroflexota bacterium]
MHTLNLGILAHVDAGKTSLTERLLYAAGVIDAIGSVDDGSTQTDTLALERQRGITIKSAVVSFEVNDITVNLIDTPGHPDFIAEVERVLSVLDGAVLVVSAVERVQAQTRVLMRALQRLRIPTLLFVNKIDRPGADAARVLDDIAQKLTPAIVPMGTVCGPGTHDPRFEPSGATDVAFASRLAELLADRDERLLAAYLDGDALIPYGRLRHALAEQTSRAEVYPVFFGSAITGAGIDALVAALTELLPSTDGDADGPLSGTVFKIERGPAGEKIAYVRLFSGRIQTRDRLLVRSGQERKVTAIHVVERGAAARRRVVTAGQIGKLWGLGDVQIGDVLGTARATSDGRHFAPPSLEAAVVPHRASDRSRLYRALTQLAEQDPLINLRQDATRQGLYVSLYGEVQKEVIQATLANEFGVEVEFQASTTMYIERPSGVGAAVEILGRAPNPFCATVGLRIEPAAPGSGVTFRLEAELGTIPIFVYKAVDEFRQAMAATIHTALQQGLYGWRVTDCTVTMTDAGYISPISTAADFRKLTPLVLMSALEQAGSVVCEPLHHFRLEIPADTFGAVMAILARQQAAPHTQALRAAAYLLEGEIPADRVHDLQRQLPGLTRGEGVLESAFERYEPIGSASAVPTRPRTDDNPQNRDEYLLHVRRRV